MYRLLLILFAYYCASLVATEFAMIVEMLRDRLRNESFLHLLIVILVSPYTFVCAVVVGIAMFIPAAIVVGLGEITRFRRWYYYVLSGASLGVLVFGGHDRWPQLSPIRVVILHSEIFFALCGAIGGLVFWFVARPKGSGPLGEE
jgi:hypothetical protein